MRKHPHRSHVVGHGAAVPRGNLLGVSFWSIAHDVISHGFAKASHTKGKDHHCQKRRLWARQRNPRAAAKPRVHTATTTGAVHGGLGGAFDQQQAAPGSG